MNTPKIKFLTVTQVLAIHDQMIKKFGGLPGVRDLGLIEAAVKRPQSTYDGRDLYGTLFDKAAALLQSLLKNHSFVDGNKRTALTSAGVFLRLNGMKLQNTHEDEVAFAINVDSSNLSIEEISEWLKAHCED